MIMKRFIPDNMFITIIAKINILIYFQNFAHLMPFYFDSSVSIKTWDSKETFGPSDSSLQNISIAPNTKISTEVSSKTYGYLNLNGYLNFYDQNDVVQFSKISSIE